MEVLFAVATFLGASLLFWSEPMLSKQVLPLLGGSAAVWNTCVFLFQALLLAGYAWAHAISRLRSRRLQVALHLLLVVTGLAFSLQINGDPTPDQPIRWLLGAMLRGAGIPFFALGSAAPLLQRWFSRVSTEDPYRLYVASNLGSFLALLAFPLFIEPAISIGAQRVIWRGGYALFFLVLAVCAVVFVRGEATDGTAPEPARTPLAWKRRLRWLLLAAAPSSLVLGTTTHLTTDLAAVPLLWVVPLALYLLTFVLAFGKYGGSRPRLWPVLAVMSMLQLFIVGAGATHAVLLPIVMLLGVLFLAALLCHGELSADRPPPSHLTEFYLWISIGGALGGLFNGVLAPLVFDSLAEYPVALIACVALAPSVVSARQRLTALAAGVALLGSWYVVKLVSTADIVADAWLVVRMLVVYAAPLIALGWALRTRRMAAFALVAGPVLVANAALGMPGKMVLQKRSFFGLHRVQADRVDGEVFHSLFHGGTTHGIQRMVEDERRNVPTTYFHPDGPIGPVFELLNARPTPLRTGIVGLGTGAIASYGRRGDHYTFFEIDPLIARIATNPALFTYLPDAKATVDIVLGDGRLQLAQALGEYDLIILDAFSSDAIPVHLLTKEALEVAYLPKLASNGWLLLHVSNRYLKLDAVGGALARSAGLDAWMASDDGFDDETQRTPSTWMLLARPGTADALENVGMWKRWTGTGVAWTDDFSNLWGVMRSLR